MSENKMRITARPLYQQVRDLLVAKITAGDWKPGGALPNETQLAQQLNISIGTVRKALELMEVECIIVRRQGRGTFVNDFASPDAPNRFSTIFDAATNPVADTKRLKSFARAPSGPECATSMDLSADDEILRIERLRLHQGKCFMAETCILPASLFKLMPEDLASYRLTASAQQNGLVIGNAVERVDAVAAGEEQVEDLEVALGTPLLRLERRIYSDSRRVLEWRLAYCCLRAERYLVEFQ